jgi:hypothetical protein
MGGSDSILRSFSFSRTELSTDKWPAGLDRCICGSQASIFSNRSDLRKTAIKTWYVLQEHKGYLRAFRPVLFLFLIGTSTGTWLYCFLW